MEDTRRRGQSPRGLRYGGLRGSTGPLTSAYTLCIRQCVSSEEYKRAFEAATRELEAALQQRANLEQRINQLRHTLIGLSRLCGYTPTVSWGMTDGVRFALRSARRPLTPLEVREELANWGLDMSKYVSDLSAIHTTLKRLQKAGEVRAIRTGRGTAYESIGPRKPMVIALTKDKA